MLPSSEGVESELVSGFRELRLGSFQENARLSAYLPRADLEFLVAQPLYFENSVVEKQVQLQHFDRRDVRDYTSIAIEMGALDSDSAEEFLAARHLIPGGSQIGIYPKSWLTCQLAKRELIDRQFLSRYRDRIETYEAIQVRAVSFLAECLGSFLLVRHLTEKYSNNIPAEIFGYVTVILDGNIRRAQGIQKVNKAKK